MRELISKIKLNRELYWKNGSSEITDSEYDDLLLRLEAEDPNHELLQPIEGPVLSSDKVKHKKQLLSLNKIFSVEELGVWMSKVARDENEEFSIEPKYDGLACRLYRDDGGAKLVTRGDGEYGENISHIIPLVKIASSANIDFDNNVDVEGELVCKKIEFKNTSATRSSGDKYKTERNLVAGIANNKEISPFKGKVELTLVEYNTRSYIRTMKNIDTDWDAICKEFGSNLDFPTDGLVIKLVDIDYSESLGNTAKFPRGQIALKFPDEIKEAKLIDVIFQVGKRKITPVAIIEPTVLEGVTIKRVTLHNAKFIIDNSLKINDTLKIIRSGQVIPKVIGTIQNEDESQRKQISINSCPSCGGEVEYSEPNVFCISDECGGSIRKQLSYAVGVLGIDVLGPGTIDKIVNTYNSKNVVDVLTLEYSDFIKLDGFADTSAQKAEDALAKILSSKIEDYKLFTCINAQGIGSSLWKSILANHYPEDLLDMDVYSLSEINGIGLERAQIIEDALENNSELIGELLSMFDVEFSKDTIGGLPKVCFSGRFPHPKAHYMQIAKRKGFDVVSSVTKNLKYLITDGATTSKVSRAKSLGVIILTSDRFLEL